MQKNAALLLQYTLLNTLYNLLRNSKLEQIYFEKIHRNKITPKKKVQATLIFDISRIYQDRFDISKDILKRPLFLVSQKHIKISMSKLHKFSIQIVSKKYIETTSIFCSSKLCRKNYIEMTKIFGPLNSSRSKHVQTRSIFDQSKLGQRNVKRNGACTVNLMETQEKLC